MPALRPGAPLVSPRENHASPGPPFPPDRGLAPRIATPPRYPCAIPGHHAHPAARASAPLAGRDSLVTVIRSRGPPVSRRSDHRCRPCRPASRACGGAGRSIGFDRLEGPPGSLPFGRRRRPDQRGAESRRQLGVARVRHWSEAVCGKSARSGWAGRVCTAVARYRHASGGISHQPDRPRQGPVLASVRDDHHRQVIGQHLGPVGEQLPNASVCAEQAPASTRRSLS